jgi:sugar phosphate isomerase/epimerase
MSRPAPFELTAHTFGLVWQHDVVEAVELLAARGFSSIEILAMPPHLDSRNFSAETKRRLLAALERHKVKVLALDLPSNDINLGSTAAEVVDFTAESYEALLAVAADLGARWMVVLPGRRHGLLPPPDGRLLDIVRRAFDRLSRAAETRGVRLLLENHPQSLLPDAASIAAFVTAQGYPNLDVVYDVANGFAIGEDAVAGMKTVEPFLGMVHLSDSPVGQWRHDPIGSGAIDFGAVRDHLLSIGYTGAVVVEIIAEQALQRLVEARDTLRHLGWAIAG